MNREEEKFDVRLRNDDNGKCKVVGFWQADGFLVLLSLLVVNRVIQAPRVRGREERWWWWWWWWWREIGEGRVVGFREMEEEIGGRECVGGME
jgi:hypothetical protein